MFQKYDSLWKSEFEELKSVCDSVGIEFLSNPFDMESASAAPEDEVIEFLKHHRLFNYFTVIGGSPRLKSDIINDFLVRFDLDSESCVLIGDSMNDLKAAQKSGVHFWGYNNSDLEDKCTYVRMLLALDMADWK